MTAKQETSDSTRSSRGSRRRPDLSPPQVVKIRPGSGLSRAEVIANQRMRIFNGFAAALAYHGYEDTKVTDIVELSGVSRATFYERFESKELCFAAAYEDGVERLAAVVGEAARGERDWANRLSAGLMARSRIPRGRFAACASPIRRVARRGTPRSARARALAGASGRCPAPAGHQWG